MARYRVNPNAICSSKNYKQSKKLHMDMLKRNHEVFMESESMSKSDIDYENKVEFSTEDVLELFST